MDIIYLATFLVAFISSILSGVAGGGGGFVMSPYWLEGELFAKYALAIMSLIGAVALLF